MSKRNYLIIEMSVAALLLLIVTVSMFPRFTGSQVRSKIAMAFQRMHTINQANQAYYMDHNIFITSPYRWTQLTTPTVYLRGWDNTVDPFSRDLTSNGMNNRDLLFWGKPVLNSTGGGYIPVSFYYHGINSGTASYMIGSNGPSAIPSSMSMSITIDAAHFTGGYHSSNGLLSQGLLMATDAKVFDDS